MKTDAFDIHFHERMLHAKRIKYLYDKGDKFTNMPTEYELTEGCLKLNMHSNSQTFMRQIPFRSNLGACRTRKTKNFLKMKSTLWQEQSITAGTWNGF